MTMLSLIYLAARRVCTVFIFTAVVLSGGNSVGNPLFSGADPEAHVFGKEFWIYPTGNGWHLNAYSSTDLQTWQDRGSLLNIVDIPWIKADGQKGHQLWAPSIIEKANQYYFYYAVGPQSAKCPSRMGVATGDRPEGPFKDSGRPLATGGGHGFEAIDPMVFMDPKSGATYLYAGGSAGAKLRVWELNDDMISLKREIPVETPPQFTEGTFMHVRNGIYYLSYSHGSYNHADYSVHYSIASTPVGPWTYKGCILQSDASHRGPGHHSFFQNPSTGEWFIVYHRWETTELDGPFKGNRQIAIEHLEYNADGTIKPVVMTDGPISPSFVH